MGEDEIQSVEATGVENEDLENAQKDRYLSFKLGDKQYAVDIKYVMEIIGIMNITDVPNTKNFIKGIINLRGNITPVICLRSRFGMEESEYDDRTTIIVIEYENYRVGLIVDEVAEVQNIPEEAIAPPPETNKGFRSRFIEGMGKIGKQILIILNLNNVLFDTSGEDSLDEE